MSPYAIRPVRPEDVPAVVRMVHELAAFERAPEQCRLTEEQLHTALFRPEPALYGHVGVDPGGEPQGFTLWFLSFSTWAGVHGIYLEDLYVLPEARGRGLGRDLLAALAGECVRHGYARLDWSVLDWNPARRFYAGLGAVALDEWIPYRLTGDALAALARTSSERDPTAGQSASAALF